MTGWATGVGRGSRCCEDDKLYGRGGADDGYAAFASLTAIRAAAGAGHPARALRRPDRGLRGERQLRPALLHRPPRRRASARRASSSASIRAAATTTSCGARPRCAASLVGTLTVEGADRGRALGRRERHRRRPSFRIARPLLVAPRGRDAPARSWSKSCIVDIPPAAHRAGAAPPPACSATRSPASSRSLPGARPMTERPVELVLNRTWRPTLAVTGADGPAGAGERRQRPASHARLKLSLRLPPTLDAGSAAAARQDAPGSRSALRRAAWSSTSSRRSPAGTRRRWRRGSSRRSHEASRAILRPRRDVHGRGRHDPVHGHARREVPGGAVPDHRRARPAANAHGPNEFLHLACARHLTVCVAQGDRGAYRREAG